MNYFLKILLFITVLALSVVQSAFANTRIVILGDSLSASLGMKQDEGWVHLLKQDLESDNKPIELVNASISGETTGGGLARIEQVLQVTAPDILLIELGGNDGLRGFNITTIKNNLLQIIEKAKAKNVRPVIMQIRIPPNYGPVYTNQFEAVFAAIAEKEQITLLPFFMDTVAVKPELMQADGIHPNKEAQPVIRDIMRDKILGL